MPTHPFESWIMVEKLHDHRITSQLLTTGERGTGTQINELTYKQPFEGALIRLREFRSELLLVAHTTLLEISCQGSFYIVLRHPNDLCYFFKPILELTGTKSRLNGSYLKRFMKLRRPRQRNWEKDVRIIIFA